MNISGKILYDKARNLRPELSSFITPEILDEICDEPFVQPFLEWFCENMNRVNVISDEEAQIKNKLQSTNEWLEGIELNNALEEATRNCPDLLKTTCFDDKDISDLFAEFEIVKQSYEEDESYIRTLQNGIQNLKKLKNKLDENIEKEETLLDNKYIEVDKMYKDCSVILRELDSNNCEFLKEIKYLLNVYGDAAENKGAPLLWTQMPLELFIKKIELYNHYLGIHIRQQFENGYKDSQEKDSNYVSLIDKSKEKHMDYEELQELMHFKTYIINTKMEEVTAKILYESCISMLQYAQDIYNSGNVKVPRNFELRTEISELTKMRDYLEENVFLLQEHQLSEVIQDFVELEITKILKQNAESKLKQKTIRLEKLKNFRFLACDCGHVHADLLNMVMQMQYHRLQTVSEFVPGACHYLTMEYSLSSARCKSMQQQQDEYLAVTSSSPKLHNSFNNLLVSMISSGINIQELNSALNRYNELLDENKNKKQFVFETYLNSKIHKLEALENDVNLEYVNEMHKGATYGFKSLSYEVETCYKEAFDHLQKIQTDLTKTRNQMKEQMKNALDFEYEKNVLWQLFLADPDALKRKYREVKQMVNKSCFENTFEID
ncbi:HAUS augmin-like complex subunit 3 [Hylaeus volcanicus]|uniref:HAUS augmin-like complex subunit 3 n=1 Tax=Hylaeus volcanicus TaxID=313075 RepID=UPI0023B807AC|nr:HAUS augmin-like complex subunit 3 [Hylaeus volcanicus]